MFLHDYNLKIKQCLKSAGRLSWIIIYDLNKTN